MASALSSLTEMYTDSENEEGESHRESIVEEEDKRPPTPELGPPPRPSTPGPASRKKNLVSYTDDTVLSDDEKTPDKVPESPLFPKVDKIESILTSFDDVDMPHEPKGECSDELTNKISGLMEKAKQGVDMNHVIQNRKTFRNPSIYEKLIEFCKINEFGTNYEPKIYDPLKWNEASYYDELAKQQKIDWEQRDKDKKTKVEIIQGTAKKSNGSIASDEDARRRKSKWDQVGIAQANLYIQQKAAALHSAHITSSATGTKGTVISAFGSFSKKPK